LRILNREVKISPDYENENEAIPILCMTSSVSMGFPVPSRGVGRENDIRAFSSRNCFPTSIYSYFPPINYDIVGGL
jgi:hypothetical protein